MFTADRLAAFETMLPIRAVTICMMAVVAGLVLLASGGFGTIAVHEGSPVDAALVVTSLWHAVLGCAIMFVEWLAGAGIIAWFRRDDSAPIGELMLIGFPVSLPLVAVTALVAIETPFGVLPGAAILCVSCAGLLRHARTARQLFKLAGFALAVTPAAILLGCWLGLAAHGPTAVLAGRPSGDVGFYASSIYALRDHPFPLMNYGNEGEFLSPFNALHPLLGAALMGFVPIEPFQFVLATGGSMFLLGLALAIYCYMTTVPELLSVNSAAILAGAAVVGIRYPYWIVESPSVIWVPGLTIAVWYLGTARKGIAATGLNTVLASVGSALSKVTSIVTLGAFALSQVLDDWQGLAAQYRKLPMFLRLSLLMIAVAGIGYALLMLRSFGPLMLRGGGLGPESYGAAVETHQNWRVVTPFFLRDCGMLLLGVSAWRILPPGRALAVCLGLASTLLQPYAFMINFTCASLIVALAAVHSPLRHMESRNLVLVAFLFCAPAMAFTDWLGSFTSAIWTISVVAAVWVAFNAARPSISQSRNSIWQTAIVLTFVCVAGSVAMASHKIVLVPNPEAEWANIPAPMQDIWTAVRDRVPRGSLVFTDQTGNAFGVLQNWNTYAATGDRQVYLAGWYQSPELRLHPELLAAKQTANAEVLSGRLAPGSAPVRAGPYKDYYAVVHRTRTMPANWRFVYRNSDYALFHYALPAS